MNGSVVDSTCLTLSSAPLVDPALWTVWPSTGQTASGEGTAHGLVLSGAMFGFRTASDALLAVSAMIQAYAIDVTEPTRRESGIEVDEDGEALLLLGLTGIDVPWSAARITLKLGPSVRMMPEILITDFDRWLADEG